MNLHTQIDETGTARIQVRGDLDFTTAHHLGEAGLLALTSTRCQTLLLDLSRVEFIDAAGVSALLRIRNRAPSAVILHEPSPCVARVLSLTGLLSEFVVTTPIPASNLPA